MLHIDRGNHYIWTGREEENEREREIERETDRGRDKQGGGVISGQGRKRVSFRLWISVWDANSNLPSIPVHRGARYYHGA